MGCVQGTCRCCFRGDAEAVDGTDCAAAVAADADGNGVPSSLTDLSPCSSSSAAVPSAGLMLRFASLSVPGRYPSSPSRLNQDAVLAVPSLVAHPDVHLFAVFDGHGTAGAACSSFARSRLPALLADDPRLAADPAATFRDALLAVNSALHADADIDDSMSGTTAIAVLVVGATLHVANVGDSRAVAGVWSADSSRVVAQELSRDQTPFREDERARVLASGGRVLSVEQVEGARDPDAESWLEEGADEGDPPRVWARDGMYPGTAFTRSLGDAMAKTVGVIAEPEVKAVDITAALRYFVVASDGVFEFLSNQDVVDMVSMHAAPHDACLAIATESYKRWLQHENRTDDISVIVVHVNNTSKSGCMETDQTTPSSLTTTPFSWKIKAGNTDLQVPEAYRTKLQSVTETPVFSCTPPT